MLAVGQTIVRREVLRQGPWLGVVVYVVEDSPDALVTYLPSGAPLGFPTGSWPTPDGRHPWHTKDAWQGHGTLMVGILREPGCARATSHARPITPHARNRTLLAGNSLLAPGP